MPKPPRVQRMICIVAASEMRCWSSPSFEATRRPASWNFSLNSASKTALWMSQKGSCHLKTVFFVTTKGVTFAARHRVKKCLASVSTLSSGLWYTTAAFRESDSRRASTIMGSSSSESGKKVVINRPRPTSRHPAPYSPPTACRSKSTGDLNPSSTPSMWIVSREIVTPFQPRRMAPFGDGKARFKPMASTCAFDGVTVGSLKIAPTRFPASTASRSTLSPVRSRDSQLKSKNSHSLVSTWGSTQCFIISPAAYRVISSPEMYTNGKLASFVGDSHTCDAFAAFAADACVLSC
mmetsp:Transcript_36663/g.117609  ORF Transcript_36663/g.117609 Transcript_36663/m.117609 type:complete len:293 (-) Transcript_36663:162-1040(-)